MLTLIDPELPQLRLSATLTLARASRAVTVVDAGEPMNAPADGVHGLLALDGVRPAELLARGRDEVLGYGGEIFAGEVVDASCTSYGFAVVLRDGSAALRQLREACGNPRRQKGVLSVEPRGTRGTADVDPADDQLVQSELSDRDVDLLAVG